MSRKNTPVIPWLLVICLGTAAVLTACGADDRLITETSPASTTPVPTQTAHLRLDNGAIEVQDENQVWVPIGGKTTFDLMGILENTDPWMVTGNTFAVRDFTQITEGLEVGNPVEVRGVILEDATWLAESIEPAKESDPEIALIGKVDSMDPWMIGGVMLPVTVRTRFNGRVTPGTLIRAKILLAEDGAWNVFSLAPLSDFTEIPGCTTVTATVLRVDVDEVQFAGWPPLPLDEHIKVEDEAGNHTTLSRNHLVLVVACPAEAGQFTITKIIVP